MSNPAVPEAALFGPERLAERAVAEPDRVVLSVNGGGDLTYGAWDARANAVARGLAARDVGPGSRVALLFDAAGWSDFAVAWLGVRRSGAVAVLLSPGAASADLVRALSHSVATGLLCASHLQRPAGPTWVADVADIERAQSTDPVASGVDTEAVAEIVYPPAPLAPPVGTARFHPDSLETLGPGPAVDGRLVHAWAPGSLAGQFALSHALAGAALTTRLGPFDPERLCALLADRRAGSCGLTPALAAALLGSGATSNYDLSSVRRVVLSGPPSAAVRAGLQAAFTRAEVAVIVEPLRRAPGTDAVGPVAVSQEGMLWHEQFAPGSFNLPCLVRRYRGPLDVAALGWALAEVVRRHQPLRSIFGLVDGRPVQTVAQHRPFSPAIEDLSALDPADRDERAAALLADATSRPFDLTAGPLFEPRLVRLGADDHLLVVRLHHTVFDDWSVDVLRRELSALYTARVAGAPSPLAEPAITFVDLCRRQRAALDGEHGASQRSWWRRELAGAPLAVQLSISGDGEPPQADEPLRLDLPPELARGLRALAPRLRATPFMTMLAAFSVLLSRTTGQDDLVIATVVAHRDGSDVEPLVGCFTKKVPLRLRLGGDPTFPDLVARTRTSLLGSLTHQDVAFDAAVQEGLGGPAADHGVVPQVAVVFQGETPQRVKLTMPELSIGPYEVRAEARRERHFSSGPAKGNSDRDTPVWGDGVYLGTFLILSVLETAEGLALVARGVFDRPAARNLLEEFESLLAQVVADPDRRISALSPDAGTSHQSDDVVELRGFRASRSRIESALGRCPGVDDCAVAVRENDAGEPVLVVYVVAEEGRPSPSLTALRHAVWAAQPGALWPAAAVVVNALVRLPAGSLDVAALPPPDRSGAADPRAELLTAMWREISGRYVGRRNSYWQDFSFLQVLAEAREAGLVLDDWQVARCRTPEMLAAASSSVP